MRVLALIIWCFDFTLLVVKIPLDAYTMDFIFSEQEDGGVFDNKNGMDYHVPVFGGIAKEPPLHIVHISVEMAPIAKVQFFIVLMLKQVLVISTFIRNNISYCYVQANNPIGKSFIDNVLLDH